jgi:hypothetical protein
MRCVVLWWLAAPSVPVPEPELDGKADGAEAIAIHRSYGSGEEFDDVWERSAAKYQAQREAKRKSVMPLVVSATEPAKPKPAPSRIGVDPNCKVQ